MEGILVEIARRQSEGGVERTDAGQKQLIIIEQNSRSH